MRFLKLFLAAAMCGALAIGWVSRASVLDAYQTDREPLDFSLDGLDLEVEAAERTPSPFVIPPAPDTRRASLALDLEPTPPTTVPASLAGGSASIGGWVSGPAGAVDGAIVIVERHTLDGSASTRVIADATGAWSVTGVKGGRFRVRAYLPGAFASGSTEVFFLDADARMELNLAVVGSRQGPIVSFTGPSTLEVGSEHAVAVSVGYEVVDIEGRLVLQPAAGVNVAGSIRGSVDLLSANQVTTDGYGAARYRVRCNQPNSNVLTVTIDGQSFGFSLPACIHRPLEGGAAGGGDGDGNGDDETPDAATDGDGGNDG